MRLYPHIPHGQSVALFYPHWIALSHVGNPAKFADIAEILAPETATLPVRAAQPQVCRQSCAIFSNGWLCTTPLTTSALPRTESRKSRHAFAAI